MRGDATNYEDKTFGMSRSKIINDYFYQFKADLQKSAVLRDHVCTVGISNDDRK